MHTELMSDGYLKLYQAGKITNKKKTLNRGKGVFSICSGSRELYEFLDQNMDILSAPMRYVNNPETIRQLDHFVSINGCIAMDLYGQVCSETSGTRHISGTGGSWTLSPVRTWQSMDRHFWPCLPLLRIKRA